MARSGRAATKVPEPRMEHGLNTERESALMTLEKEEITEKISSQLHLKGFFWESVFNSCSIGGSPENLVGNERFLLIVVRISGQFLLPDERLVSYSPIANGKPPIPLSKVRQLHGGLRRQRRDLGVA